MDNLCTYQQKVAIFLQKICGNKKIALYLQSQNGFSSVERLKYAEIAQLVEHNLAKVGVASSSLVFRSKSPK